MNNKPIFIIRLINSIFIVIVLIYLYIITSNAKIVLIPFLICSIAELGKNIFILLKKTKYVKVCNKLFILSFLLFWFGFLIYGSYICFVNSNYQLLIFTIPFWIIGINIIKKNFLKNKNKKEICETK